MKAAEREAVREVLSDLADQGRLSSEDVVAEASDPKSVLHDLFEWNDGEAAHKYRLDQARRLIRKVELVIIREDRILTAPTYVRDPDAEPREPGYVRTVEVATEEDKARAALETEIRRVRGHLNRVESLAAAFDLEEEAQRVTDALAALEGLVVGV